MEQEPLDALRDVTHCISRLAEQGEQLACIAGLEVER